MYICIYVYAAVECLQKTRREFAICLCITYLCIRYLPITSLCIRYLPINSLCIRYLSITRQIKLRVELICIHSIIRFCSNEAHEVVGRASFSNKWDELMYPIYPSVHSPTLRTCLFTSLGMTSDIQ